MFKQKKYVLLPPSTTSEFPALELVYENETSIYENKNVFSRLFFVPSYQFCPSRQKAYETLASYTRDDFKRKVILESEPPRDFEDIKDDSYNKINSRIKWISHEPNKIEIEVSTNQKGFMVLSDNYHPDWKAEIDGMDVKVLRANYIMRAIPVKLGIEVISLKRRRCVQGR